MRVQVYIKSYNCIHGNVIHEFLFVLKGAFKASAFFGAKDSDNHIKEFNEKFELLGPLMFGLHDGQTEAPKIQAQKVNFIALNV